MNPEIYDIVEDAVRNINDDGGAISDDQKDYLKQVVSNACLQHSVNEQWKKLKVVGS